MSVVDKMLIKGIRSFSPDNQYVIEFYKPLTLIVGQNGAGKTTIIECLNQACTGDLPPNTRSGQSFIHDPKVAGETEVKAQIKLRIKNSHNVPYVIVRSFSLTQKKTNMQFKAIDQTVQTYNRDTQEKEALSYKCVDMDRFVPTLMGASKAILENVIFVHQEDSNWPLAEGQVLKKRFDDIFASSKYTKALEEMRKMRTSMVADVKALRANLAHVSTILDSANDLRNAKARGEKEHATLRARADEAGRGIQAAEEEHMRALETLGRIQSLVGRRDALDAQAATLMQSNAATEDRLRSQYPAEDMSMGDAELQSRLDNSASLLADAERAQRAQQADLEVARGRLDAAKHAYEEELKKHSRLVAERDAHNFNVQQRDAFVEQYAEQLGAPRGASGEDLAQRLRIAVTDAQRDVDRLRSEHQAADDEATKRVDAAQGAVSSAREAARLARAQAVRNEQVMSQLQREVEGLAVNQALLAAEEANVAALEEEQATKQAAAAAADGPQLADLDAQLQSLRDTITALRQERDRVASAGAEAHTLKLKQRELLAKQADLEGKLGVHKERVLSVLGTKVLPPASDLRAALEAAAAQRAQQLQQARSTLADLQSTVAAHNATLQQRRAQAAKLEDEARSLRAAVKAQLTALPEAAETMASGAPGSLAAALQRVQDDWNKAQGTLSKLLAVQGIGTHNKSKLLETHSCPTCRRGCRDDELQAVLDLIEQQIAAVPAQVEATRARLATLDAALARLRPLGVDDGRAAQLEAEGVPAAARAAEDEAAALEQAQRALAQGEATAAAAEEQHRQAVTLLQDVGFAVHALAEDVQQRQQEIQAMTARASSHATGRTVADVDLDLEDAEHRKGQLEQDKDRLARRHNRLRDDLSNVTARMHAAQQALTAMRGNLGRREELLRQVEGLKSANAELLQDSAKQEAELADLDAQRAQRVEERKAAREARRAQLQDAEGRLRELQSVMDRLQHYERQLEAFERGGAVDLARAEEAVQRLRGEQEALTQEITAHQAAVAQHEHRLRNAGAIRAELQDILAWKESVAKHGQLLQQRAGLDSQLQELGTHMAAEERVRDLAAKLKALQAQHNRDLGALETVARSVKDSTQQLESNPNFRGIDQLYKQRAIEVETTEKAAGDLEKYHKALERALLAYHTTKMEDINKLIKELWQKTYRGADIDYIQIKADADGQRSYNYRVVMHSNGAELDMRGRCSAGQKIVADCVCSLHRAQVLACLVIRLALAEVFCTDCGVLALDEPTTNLDYANSQSLAEALRELITSRRGHNNFQLIVITHDEQCVTGPACGGGAPCKPLNHRFAQLIGTREMTQYMWRVTKDDNGHSHVEQEVVDV